VVDAMAFTLDRDAVNLFTQNPFILTPDHPEEVLHQNIKGMVSIKVLHGPAISEEAPSDSNV